MKLYLITQNTVRDWNTYSSAVVAARSPVTARRIHPDGSGEGLMRDRTTWVNNPALVTAEYIGTATRGSIEGVICAACNTRGKTVRTRNMDTS